MCTLDKQARQQINIPKSTSSPPTNTSSKADGEQEVYMQQNIQITFLKDNERIMS